MNVHYLKNALVLARKLHFTQAAKELNIVQPALSRQIRQLEEDLGAKLFRRNKRNVELTEAGRFFVEEVEEVLNRLDRLCQRTAQIHRGEVGEIRIGFTHSIMQSLLPDILQRIHRLKPGLRAILREMNNRGQYEALRNKEIDLGFATNPLVPSHLESKVLLVDNFVVLLPQDHPVDEGNYRGFSVFAKEDFIFPTPTDGINYVRILESICLDAGFTPRVIHETDSATTGFRLVEAGLGISIEPVSSLHNQVLNIKRIELKTIPQKARLTMMWRPDFEKEYPDLFEMLVISKVDGIIRDHLLK